MHSYACQDCAAQLQIKGLNCPICRLSILNLLFLEIIEAEVIQKN